MERIPVLLGVFAERLCELGFSRALSRLDLAHSYSSPQLAGLGSQGINCEGLCEGSGGWLRILCSFSELDSWAGSSHSDKGKLVLPQAQMIQEIGP